MSVFGDHRARHSLSPDRRTVRDVPRRAIRARPRSSISIPAPRSASASSTRLTTDVAAFLKSRGVTKGSRVLLLSDENLEKLLLWFGIWRLGAVVCPLNIEINEKVLADLAPVVNPALILYHKDLDCDALVGDCKAPRVRFGAWSADGADRPAGRVLRGDDQGPSRRGTARAQRARRTSPASSARRARPAGRRSWSTITAPIGSTASRRWNSSASPRTTARSNTARSAGTRRRC